MNKNKKFEKYRKKAEKLLGENEKVNALLQKTSGKLKSIVNSSDKLKEFSDRIQTLYRMVKAQIAGEYTVLPWKTIVMIVGSLLYFVTPLDMIPDFIPGIGLTDDIAIVYWIYNSILEDIEQFENWEKTIEIQPADES